MFGRALGSSLKFIENFLKLIKTKLLPQARATVGNLPVVHCELNGILKFTSRY